MENITLSIFVPCFNEEKNIINALNNIKKAIENINYEILIVNDGSTDKTFDMVGKFKKHNPNLNIKIFHNEKNLGIGFNNGLVLAKINQSPFVISMADSLNCIKISPISFLGK